MQSKTIRTDGRAETKAANTTARPARTRRSVLRTVATGAAVVAAGGFAGCSTANSSTNEAGGAAAAAEGGEESDTPADELVVVIDYSGEWSGALSLPNESQSIDGYGTERYTISPAPDYLSVTAQKLEESVLTLEIRILWGGDIINKTSTTADYGVASLSVQAE